MTSAKTELMQARALIAKPDGWTTSAFARDDTGTPVDVHDKTAVCFCALGAIARVRCSEKARNLLADAARQVDTVYGSILMVNDDPMYGHASVLRMYDKAIELAEES